jgi:transcriptional regulator pecS
LDTSGTEIIGRIVRISSIVGRSVDKNLVRFQMTVGEFDVLAALAREKKQELMPKQL